MRKHLLATLLLACGMPAVGGFTAYAAPEPQSQSQATVSITGTVFDENNEPIIGASVVQKGVNTNATVTDYEGNFSIRVAQGSTLRVSFVGYKTVDVTAQQGMSVYMQPTTEMLNELVAIGYGSQKKANLTGAVSTVDVARVMEGRPYQDVTQALQGSVPGLTIGFSNGELDASSSVRIRGIGTLSAVGNGSPLYVVDGVEMNDISYLNPQDIESISVLKDAASSAIYGTRAAFGVILVQTKGADKGQNVKVRYTNNFGWSQATYLPEYPSVPEQLRAGIAGFYRSDGGRAEGFTIFYDELLPYAEAWEKQYGGKRGYGEMQAFESWDNVGDYAGANGKALYYANWDVAGIWFNDHAFSQSHNISINGTSGNTNYYLTFGYDGKEGLIKFNPDHRTKYNVSANINTKITQWLEAGVRFNWNRTSMYRPNTYWTNALNTIWRWGSWFGPWGYITDENGVANDFRYIADRKEARTRTNTSDLLRMTAYLKANLTKDITLNADFTYWTRSTNEKGGDGYVYGINQWARETEPSFIINQSESYTDRRNGKYNTWNFNVYADYHKTWNDKHNLGVMLGVNAQNEQYEYFTASRSNLYDLNTPMLNLASGVPSVTASGYEKAYAGYFGRITYNFRDTYLVEFNGRYDGSSSFPGGKKWGFFPSVSAGYRISQENFWEPIRDAWSNAKIRASYGEVGNENINNYSFYSVISALSTASEYWVAKQGDPKVNMFNMPTLVSSNLTWERIRTTDVGVDLGFMNNSLNITFDWYQRVNANMLAPVVTLPSVLGASSPVENAGSLRTRGWELSVGWNRSFGDWMVYANASISDGVSDITKWDNDNRLINSNYSGKRYGDIWGFETERYFTENDFNGKDADGKWIYKPGVADQTGLQMGTFVYGPGDIKYKDINGDGVIDGGAGTEEDHGDLKVIGNSLPRYEYSFRLGAGFKGFDLDLFFTGIGKQDVWSISPFNFPLMRAADLTIFANQTSYNVYDPDNGVVNISESNDYPCLFAGNEGGGSVNGILEGRNNYYPQSKYLINRAYLRCKNITFGYTIPAELTKKAYIENARIYFSCNNPFMLYKGNNLPVDPEVSQGSGYSVNQAITGNASLYWGRSIPVNRTFSFGVQVTF